MRTVLFKSEYFPPPYCLLITIPVHETSVDLNLKLRPRLRRLYTVIRHRIKTFGLKGVYNCPRLCQYVLGYTDNTSLHSTASGREEKKKTLSQWVDLTTPLRTE